MKLGTQVKLPDGRMGTVVFNGLMGIGVKWGLHNPDPKEFEGTSGDCFGGKSPRDWTWYPDALLRTYPKGKIDGIECVGDEFEIIKEGIDF